MKIKYLAAVLIGIAGLGLQQAKADGCVGTDCLTWTSTLNQSNGQGSGSYGTVTVVLDVATQTATITFTALNGYSFLDGSSAGVNVNSTNFSHSATATELPVSDFKQFTSGNVDGLGSFNLVVDNNSASVHVTSISFTVTNLNNSALWANASQVLVANSHGFDAEVHYIDPSVPAPNTFFAGEAPGSFTIPDGGTTVMLLGIGLGALGMLGMVRRYLTS
jgi:hypothetical protein